MSARQTCDDSEARRAGPSQEPPSHTAGGSATASAGVGTLVLPALLALLACGSPDGQGLAPAGGARFEPVSTGVVRDGEQGLEWTARDSAAELAWQDAERRCRELEAPAQGAANWRLPTSEELAALYDPAHAQPCAGRSCRVDPAIDLTSPYQWSATARGERRRVYFDFANGSALAPQLRPSLTRRALCVRGAAPAAPPTPAARRGPSALAPLRPLRPAPAREGLDQSGALTVKKSYSSPSSYASASPSMM